MHSAFMAFFAEGLAAHGYRVARFEFPYMAARGRDGGRRPPDRPNVLLDAWQSVIDRLGPERLVIGGKSLGGRMASMIADAAGVRGLVCLGYPFHPPGQPEKLRIAHLHALRTPALILQGTRDSFGARDEVVRSRSRPPSACISLRTVTMASRRAPLPAAASGRTGRRRSTNSSISLPRCSMSDYRHVSRNQSVSWNSCLKSCWVFPDLLR